MGPLHESIVLSLRTRRWSHPSPLFDPPLSPFRCETEKLTPVFVVGLPLTTNERTGDPILLQGPSFSYARRSAPRHVRPFPSFTVQSRVLELCRPECVRLKTTVFRCCRSIKVRQVRVFCLVFWRVTSYFDFVIETPVWGAKPYTSSLWVEGTGTVFLRRTNARPVSPK